MGKKKSSSPESNYQKIKHVLSETAQILASLGIIGAFFFAIYPYLISSFGLIVALVNFSIPFSLQIETVYRHRLTCQLRRKPAFCLGIALLSLMASVLEFVQLVVVKMVAALSGKTSPLPEEAMIVITSFILALAAVNWGATALDLFRIQMVEHFENRMEEIKSKIP